MQALKREELDRKNKEAAREQLLKMKLMLDRMVSSSSSSNFSLSNYKK